MRQTENVLYQQSKAMFYLIFACIRLLLLAVCTIFFITQFCSKIQTKRRQAILTDIWNGKGNRKQCKLLDIGKEGTMSDQNKIVPLLPEILVSGMPKEFKVVDVPKDGNCLFTTLSRQLNLLDTRINKSAFTIRQELVTFMRDSELFNAVSDSMHKVTFTCLKPNKKH